MPNNEASEELSPMQQSFIKAATDKETWITFGDEEKRFTINRWSLSESLKIAPLHAKIMSKIISACPALISEAERTKLEDAAENGGEAEVNISLDQLAAESYLWETHLGEVADEIVQFMVASLKHNRQFGGDPEACRKYIDAHGDTSDMLEVLLKASVLNKVDNTAKKKYLDLASLYHIPNSHQS